jgi:dolichol-phosphate mannosyltransferase
VVLIPVYNEERHLEGLLSRLRQVYSEDVLLIDDGSEDRSPGILKELEGPRTHVLIQGDNEGYGATLISGFREVVHRGYDFLITMDSDGQHRPDWIPEFFEAIPDWDIVSGSRYLAESESSGVVPSERQAINREITAYLNEITHYNLTDSFCGFKAYRVAALAKLSITERGYAMPLQLWVQARHHGLRVIERAVSRIYDDPNRRFGHGLDDPKVRRQLYLDTITRERSRWSP